MIKQSEMYRISGGCEIRKICKECNNFIVGKRNKCIVYPKEQEFSWDGGRMACKFFFENEDEDQMTIADFLKDI